jgi:hypothetical protein
MKHVKDILAVITANASKAKYYHHNMPIFLRYFDSIEHYNALILAGNFKKMEQIIQENSNFSFDDFKTNFNSNK